MRRLPPLKMALQLLVLLAGVAAAGLLAGVAHGYWTSSGIGSGSGGTGSFDAPTSVSATAPADSATVAVSWSPALGPNGGPVTGYYVQRHSGGTPSAACLSSPTVLLSAATTSCEDAGVPNGSYTYTVTAVVGSWTAASEPSAATTVDAITFEVTAPSTTTAGFPVTVSVTARDGSGAQVGDYTGTVRFTSTDPGSPVLPLDYDFTPSDNGTMTFTDGVELRTGPSQSITVQETARPARTGTTNVNVTAGAVARVGFTVQPGGGAGGAAWTTQPKVATQDAYGNAITASGSVTLSIASGPAGSVLTCTNNPRTLSSGVATFAGCKITKVGTYTLSAASAGLSGDTSASFTVTVGTATKLGYAVQPSAVVAGAVISPAVIVAAQDAGGNTVTTADGTVNLAFGANPGGLGALDGTLSSGLVDGEATFADLSITKAANGYSLSATSAGLTSATSSTFNVTAGVATKVGFTVQPGGGTGGVAWATQPKVAIQDVYGNTVTGTASVTLSIGSGTGAGVLTCSANPRSVSSGVANFAGCKITRAGTYTLYAASGSLTTDTSAEVVVVTGPATKLVYTAQPSAVVAGAVISPSVTVAAQDAGGNTVTTASGTVNLAFGANPGGLGALDGTVSLGLVDGEATFADLSITKAANGYSLSAASLGLTSTTSSTFNVTAGVATKVGFTVQPGGGTAATAWATQPKVAIQDSYGNTVSMAANVGLAIASGSGGGVLTCTANPKATSGGVATFAGCKIDKSGAYTLTATSGAFTAETSADLVIVAGAATKLAYAVQPSTVVAGAVITPAVTVAVQDAQGNTVTSSSATVALSIATNPGGGTLSGTTSQVAVGGEAVFDDLAIDHSGTGYALSAASTGLAGATSSTFNVDVGAAAQVGFVVEPGDGTGGSVWGTQPSVVIQDSQGNTVTTSSASVTLSIASGTSGALLSCSANPAVATSGVATFAGCQIDKSGTYTLTAASTGLTADTSASLSVTVGAATKLGYGVQPSSRVAGAAISPAVTVAVQDAGGNTVTSSVATVTMAIGNNAGGGTLSGTLSVAASSGVATFSNLSINKTGTGYTLTAASSGLTGDTSADFDVTPSAASKLAFAVQPSSALAGTSISPSVQVTVQDANSNTVTSSGATVTMAIGNNVGGGTLSGTLSVAASSGVATFSNLSINKTGTGYTLTAASSGLTGDTSADFDVTPGAASKLAFAVQPSSEVAGTSISPSVQVTVQDANSNTVTSSGATVAMAIGNNAGGGTLSGTLSVAASSGVATFSNLSINKTGAGYTLTAASSGLTGATSGSFNITVGAAAQVVFTTEPGSGTGGTAWATQPRVAIQDAFGNATTSTASVTLSIASGTVGAVLSCTTNPLAAVAGTATFAGCKIDKSGTYTLTAASTGLTADTSASLSVTVGAATKLGYGVQPSSRVAGAAISPAVTVAVQDAGGNTVTSSGATVAMAIGNNAGGGTLSGTLSVAASSGVATFSNLSINKTGTGYTLTAASSGLTGATSGSFNITVGAAAQVVFTTEPGSGTGGTAWATQPRVAIQDAFGNATTSTASVTLSIASGTVGAVLSCTTNPLAAVAGTATFAGCKIDKSGTYTLTAASTGLTADTSASLSVTVGAATKLGYGVQPSSRVAGAAISPAVTVAVQDAGGNTVTSSGATVAMAIGNNAGGGTLSGTLSVAASSGVATFSNLSINKTGTGYTLTAASSGLTGATSGSFNITVGAAAQVVFTTEPGSGTGGTAWATQPRVAIQDAFGNATTSTASVTLSIASGTVGAVLSCTTNPLAAVAGTATFAGCKIDKSGTYTLTAASTGLTADTSASLSVTVGAAAKLAFSVQPNGGAANVAWTSQPRVLVQDAGGNTVTTSTLSITLAITSGTGTSGAVLTCTTNPRAAVSGIATFAGCRINLVGTGYTLRASTGALTIATSSAFNIS